MNRGAVMPVHEWRCAGAQLLAAEVLSWPQCAWYPRGTVLMKEGQMLLTAARLNLLCSEPKLVIAAW